MFDSLRWFQQLRFLSLTIFVLISFFISLLSASPVQAIMPNSGIDLTAQTPIEVTASLGNKANELVFVPNQLNFVAGKKYKLVLSNPSALKHYFTAKDFSEAIWTQKVEAGNVEIKGNIRELELKPGAKAEWIFIALKPGNYGLRCIIAGHTEAGMKGNITITQ